MTHDDTHHQIAHARKAAVMSKAGSLGGAAGVVILALGVVALLTERTTLGIIAVVVAAVLFALALTGSRIYAHARQDPGVQQRSSRLRRARYRSAYPQHQQQQQNQGGDTDHQQTR